MVKKIYITKAGNYSYRLDEPGQKIEVAGRFKLTGNERMEVTIKIIHIAEKTGATVSLKATADDRAYVSFKGNVVVEETARNTESFLEERILLLSPEAKAEAIPNLEIKNNEVKCSHAATAGQIDEEQIFYLNARGIEDKKAKEMIAEGFLL